MEIPQEKTCSKCHKSQMVNQFGRDKKRRDGRAPWCKSCRHTYVIENKEALRLRSAANYQKNRGLLLQQAATRRESRREEERAYQVEYRKKFPDKARNVATRWRKANAAQRRLIEHNREARKRSLPNTWTMAEQAFMLEYWHHACAICGNPEGLFWILAFDHWIPLASPACPGTIAANMLPLCHGNLGCNNSKHKNEPHAWLVRRFDAKKVARIEKAIATYFHIVSEAFSSS
jgi:hypothetical protein